MFGNPGMFLNRETTKPKKTSETLRRFGRYFRPYWLVLIGVAVLIIFSTWTQVITPDLTGQAVDCYITPAVVASVAGGQSSSALPSATSGATNNCWYDPAAGTTAMSTADRIGGLGGLILRLVGLAVLGSIASGLSFFSMTWAGQHVLKAIRVQLFAHLQRLSLG